MRVDRLLLLLRHHPHACVLCVHASPRYRQKNVFQFDMDMPQRTTRGHPRDEDPNADVGSLAMGAAIPDDIEVCARCRGRTWWWW